jgi:hypothetical protein
LDAVGNIGLSQASTTPIKNPGIFWLSNWGNKGIGRPTCAVLLSKKFWPCKILLFFASTHAAVSGFFMEKI